MESVVEFIRENRGRTLSYFKFAITALTGIVAFTMPLLDATSPGLLLAIIFMASLFTSVVWQLVFSGKSLSGNVYATVMGADLLLTVVALMPLAAAHPAFPVLFAMHFVAVWLLLNKQKAVFLVSSAFVLFGVSYIAFAYNNIIVNPLSNFFVIFLSLLLVNGLMIFGVNVTGILRSKQQNLDREANKLRIDYRHLKRELFLNTQLVSALNRDVKRKNIEIKNILTLSGQLNLNSDSRQAIESFLYTVIGQLGSRYALIFTKMRREHNYYSIFSSKGLSGVDYERFRIYLNSNLINILKSAKEPVPVESIPRKDLYADEIKLLQFFRNDLFCPILIKGRMEGIFIVGQKVSQNAFSAEDFNLISIVANQAAFVMEQTQITSEFQDIYFKTIKAMMKALEAKYVFARGHNTRTANYVNLVSMKLGLNVDEIKDLTYGTLLHDIGKIAIRDKYLLDTQIFGEGQVIIKQKILEHTLKGASILKSAGFNESIVDLALHHHENYNGSGFPHGIGGEDLSQGVRILSVCNTFDAMTSDRPYRKALSTDVAQQYLEHHSGKKFDPRVVRAFLNEWAANKEMQKFN